MAPPQNCLHCDYWQHFYCPKVKKRTQASQTCGQFKYDSSIGSDQFNTGITYEGYNDQTKTYPNSLKPTIINQLEAGDHNLP